MKARQQSQRFNFYPGSKIPFAWADEVEKPKISQESAFWKQNLEQVGMPWNFYQALLTAARGLQNDTVESANIDKDGWLNLKYENMVVKLKITEITVEPPK